MNQQLTPQEAALYLGQEVLSEATTDSRGKLIGIEYVGGVVTWQVERADGSHFWVSAKNLTHLLLRPLSDISEEEAIEVNLYTPKREWHQMYFHEWIEEMKRQMGYRELEYTPRQIAYLLSKGFDLFNWIEQGKALDKTTLSKSDTLKQELI